MIQIIRVLHDHTVMKHAEAVASQAIDPKQKVGAVMTRPNKHGEHVILAHGCNGSTYHDQHGCERKRLGCKSGEGYELCEGCHPKNHAERKMLRRADLVMEDPAGCDVWLWGHWYACTDCFNLMLARGICRLYLVEDAEKRFRPV